MNLFTDGTVLCVGASVTNCGKLVSHHSDIPGCIHFVETSARVPHIIEWTACIVSGKGSAGHCQWFVWRRLRFADDLWQCVTSRQCPKVKSTNGWMAGKGD